ncbi:ATP-binding cassette domain-containing protein [Bifidobacterium subtile]|uniref:Putative ABC transporter ATP-binding protein n=1 Tax=Bifidobacterium subtile TaxID=77635 RepID=A0A087EA33_9BIFI|nr:ATP-binding cassette domain-containing protein [Bifidobacterium subtile]KFJ04634.1 putative ABC transporter ATP-binding protein [Bifidobacterium subtile]QOL35733.1 ATP-binding cassette domain-containing protein [Bifidobacterium subtile]
MTASIQQGDAIDATKVSDPHRDVDVILDPQEHRRAVAQAPVILRVRELKKSFQGLRAVDDVSFDLHKGEVISIIGPNGSGKSTTINLISGFLTPDSGLIDIEDEPIAGRGSANVSERGIARTFQNGRVFGALSVDENIALGYHKKLSSQRPFKGLQRFPIIRWLSLLAETGAALLPFPAIARENKEVDERVVREIDRFKERLGTRRNDLAYTLSYANRRRTEIARAHISEPKLLLLDEPTAGMNQSETAEVLQQLQYLKAQGHTILLVEHKIELVTAISDQVLAMDGGKIIASGEPDEVRNTPAVIEAYLGKRRETRISTAQADVLAKQNSIEELEEGTESAQGDALARSRETEQNATPDLLDLDDVDVFYGQVHALQQVSLHVPPKAIVSLLGGNASGKSTTMKTILGLVNPKNGSIQYQGRDITSLSTRHRVIEGIASVPEARRVFPAMTVQENLLSGAYTRSRSDDIAGDLEEMYERFPRLKERRAQQAGTMSGGEQQMLAFARALMSKPKIICMDEPTMGLSPKLVEDVLEQIVKLRDEIGVSVLLVEQQAELALSVADYGYVLQNGSIRLHGEAQTLLHDPRVQEAYLGGAKENNK